MDDDVRVLANARQPATSRFLRKVFTRLGYGHDTRAHEHGEHASATPTPRPPKPAGSQLVQEADEVSRYMGNIPTTAITEAVENLQSQQPNNSQATPGIFNNATNPILHNPTMNQVNFNFHDHQQSIEFLEKHIMQGAQFDSSARSPPPQCHPGTRKSIMDRAQRWFNDSTRKERILWLVGPAGVGKSAIMQTLSESAAASSGIILGATLFFSEANGRNKPSQVFFTLAYQIALKHTPYREFVLQEMTTSPQLPVKSMKTQFVRLIDEPFGRQEILQGQGPLLILLDGLDECEDNRAQCEIIELISAFSLKYPTSPLTWMISSRPESHLQAVFLRKSIMPCYHKEDVPVNSDEACADVEHYLREEFEKVHQDDPVTRLHVQWPTETQFVSIAAAAAGLFAYASTVIAFIGDPAYANPFSRLDQLLAVIEKSSMPSSKRRLHPLVHLDALYTCILSQIPEDILPDTRLLLTNHLVLLRNASGARLNRNMALLCNWTGTTSSDAYGALHRLHSVLRIPPPQEAEDKQLTFYHQSFREYLSDFERSGVFHISDTDMDRQELECSLRILKQVHSGMAAEAGVKVPISDVVLSWPVARTRAMQQFLYDKAGLCFTRAIDRFDPDLFLPILQESDTIHVMKTLDIPALRTAFHNVPRIVKFFHHVRHRLDPRIRVEFNNIHLLREIPVTMLSLEEVKERWRGFVFIHCQSECADIPDERRLPGKPPGPQEIDYDSRHRFWWCNDLFTRNDYLQTVLDDLQSAQVESPDMPVVFFGNVAFNCLIYDFTTPDESQHWTYFIPYKNIEPPVT